MTPQTYTSDGTRALGATWREVLLEAVLAVLLALLLDEAAIDERSRALAVGAFEVLRTPRASERQNERTAAGIEKLVFSILAIVLTESRDGNPRRRECVAHRPVA